MSIQRVHLHLSREAVVSGRRLARQRRTSMSKLVEHFLLANRNRAHASKSFSERWAGKFRLRKILKTDVRGMRLLKKYS